ncbi:MAG: NADH:flavin oxidoreductase [Bdellovibrionia bacterium]
MKHQSLSRFTGLSFQNGKRLANRVVVPPMASETADAQGFVTDKTLSHYQRLSQSRAGLVMVEYTYVDVSGRSEEKQLGAHSEEHIHGLSALAQVIHQSGALVGIQLTHAGGKTTRDLTGGALMGPSPVAVPVKDRVLETMDPMSETDIELWKGWFKSAVVRAKKAGFDLVELHAAHGYGLNQWLSPLTNHRSDSYGGTLDRRARLLLEIVREVRAEHSDLLLAVRMPGQDFMEGGLRSSEAIWLAQSLERTGIDVIDVSSGIGGWRRPRNRTDEGYLVDEASAIQASVDTPVIGVGGIETGAYIDQSLSQGRFALAAVGRAILKDPGLWGDTHLAESVIPSISA